MKVTNPDLDVILVAGDHVAHGISANSLYIGRARYQQLKATHSEVAAAVRARFPGALLVPTVGNNDGPLHY